MHRIQSVLFANLRQTFRAGKQNVSKAGYHAAPGQDGRRGSGRGVQGARDGSQEHHEGHRRNGIDGLKKEKEEEAQVAHMFSIPSRDTVSHSTTQLSSHVTPIDLLVENLIELTIY